MPRWQCWPVYGAVQAPQREPVAVPVSPDWTAVRKPQQPLAWVKGNTSRPQNQRSVKLFPLVQWCCQTIWHSMMPFQKCSPLIGTPGAACYHVVIMILTELHCGICVMCLQTPVAVPIPMPVAFPLEVPVRTCMLLLHASCPHVPTDRTFGQPFPSNKMALNAARTQAQLHW